MTLRKFKSPSKNYQIGEFKTTTRHKSPSPKLKDFEKRALTKDDKKSICTYIHPDTGKRCKNLLGLYAEYCELHTMMVYNVFIGKSKIKGAGNGLYTGPYGFKKGDIIGQYSFPWNAVKLKTIENRCTNDNCMSYVFCGDEITHDKDNPQCWDGLDIRSTIMRNINDAHNSAFRNNAFFDVIKGHVYVIASRTIKPMREIYVNYGRHYWQDI